MGYKIATWFLRSILVLAIIYFAYTKSPDLFVFEEGTFVVMLLFIGVVLGIVYILRR